MNVDPSLFAVGGEWVYRLRSYAPSERVLIKAITRSKNSARLDVAFLDDPSLREENVPGSRLRAPWSEVESYNALMANWQRIDNLKLDTVEESCADDVFRLLIPEDAAVLQWLPVHNITAIHHPTKLAEILHAPVEEILAGVECFDHDGTLMVSPAGTLRIAEAACKAHPMPVLAHVSKEEIEARRKSTHGSVHARASVRETGTTSPETEYRVYREFDQPRHELLRQWCGHRAVSLQERLLAAEAEVRRLDILTTTVIKALAEAGADFQAQTFAEEHERDRITPYTIRPTIEDPAGPARTPADADEVIP
ncbi:hypothetical protein ACQP2X_12625 [Actinoplanes sp. CA-131856]